MGNPQDLAIEQLFDHLWRGYAAITPQAPKIQALLQREGEHVVNDHVAFRTFDHPLIDIHRLAQPFLALGYRHTGDYDFPEKRLSARSYSHPNRQHPRVFLSHLRSRELPLSTQARIDRLVGQLDRSTDPLAMIRGDMAWPLVTRQEYEDLLVHSEYAAWLAAFGLRVNHFTVSVNELRRFSTLPALNAFVVSQGFRLNGSQDGRVIQGSPAVYLEQSSTVADQQLWRFSDGEFPTPTCYYEFALRYDDPQTGERYDGFVSTSADKIFESTDAKHHIND